MPSPTDTPSPSSSALLPTQSVLEFFSITRPTLARWVRDQGFPPPIRCGQRRTFYSRAALEAWVASRPKAGTRRAA